MVDPVVGDPVENNNNQAEHELGPVVQEGGKQPADSIEPYGLLFSQSSAPGPFRRFNVLCWLTKDPDPDPDICTIEAEQDPDRKYSFKNKTYSRSHQIASDQKSFVPIFQTATGN